MILQTMQALAQCLCDRMKAAGYDPPCFCGVMPGSAVALDYLDKCNSVIGYVRMGLSYPASGIGVPNRNPGNCGAGRGYDLEMGVWRHMPSPDRQGNPPSQQALFDVTGQQAIDMEIMRQAILCCSGGDCSDLDIDVILGTYSPAGPEGGAVGGFWTFYVLED